MSRQKSMLHQATNTDLEIIFANSPVWLYKHKGLWMCFHKPEWVAKFDPANMLEVNPHYMVKHKTEWMAFNAPATLFLMDLPALTALNPKWLVDNRLYHTAYNNKELCIIHDPITFGMIRTELGVVNHNTPRFWRMWKFFKTMFSSTYHLAQTAYVDIPPGYLVDKTKNHDIEEVTCGQHRTDGYYAYIPKGLDVPVQ